MFLWNSNRAQQPAYVIIPSLLFTLACLALIYLVSIVLLRNVQRAALITTLGSLFILSYGHLENLLNNSTEGEVQTSFLPVAVGLVLIILVFLIIRRAGSPQLTRILNLVAALLVVFQVVTAMPYYLTMSAKAHVADEDKLSTAVVPKTSDGKLRDVYFILIDNYSREDILRSKYNLDNTELVDALKERGFIFPDCAQGNYFATAPVISSILNMNYLADMGIKDSAYTSRTGYTALAPLMQDSEVMRKFHAYGYHTVTFRGFMGLIDIQTSDTYINYESDQAYTRRLETKNFNALYLETTLFYRLNQRFKIYPDWVREKGPEFLKQYLPQDLPIEERFYQVYQQNLYAYEALERIPTEIKGPKFVYAHIYSAHWPFMMSPDGSLRLPFSQLMTPEGYVAGIKYSNNRVLQAIDTILANSETPPVIILQGDHSDGWVGKVEWSGMDRLKILSAYYLPGGGDKLLYDTISPVNNFRLVFQYYFGEPLNLLPDEWHYLDPLTRTIKDASPTCISQEK